MSTPLLELKDFKYSYGNIEVIHGIDLKVDVGECVTIIGANGAGKTTTLQAISGLLSPRGVRGAHQSALRTFRRARGFGPVSRS